MRSLGRCVVVVALTAGVLGVAACGSARAATAPFIVANNCVEHQAFVYGDEAAVEARLPKGFTLQRDAQTGRPLLFVRAEHCDVTFDGGTAPATLASAGILIQSPDGLGCNSGVPGAGQVKGDAIPYCNWYPLFWVSDDPRVTAWLRADTPDYPAVDVRGLAFTQSAGNPVGGVPFHFQAPAPTPSPFTMDDIGHPGSSPISVRGGYWVKTAEGTVKLAFSTDDIVPGSASGFVHAAKGSELARLMGTDQEPYLPAYSNIGAEHWDHGSYRKQIIGPAPNTDTFSGSCSVQGTDYFSPPASNTPRQLSLRYEATGTCSGSLNGRSVSAAAVTLTTSSQPYGTCGQARTLAPGTAVLRFPDNTAIRMTYEFTSAGTEVDGIYYGERSGYARSHATFITQRTGPDVITQCAASGAAQAPMDLTLTTVEPLVSQHPGGTTQQGSGSPRRAPQRLRLAVQPQSVVAGRRVRFRFRVTTSAGRPVGGATVSFAGHHARANRRGIAQIVTVIRRAGGIVARVATPGERPAAVTVRVRRVIDRDP